MVCGALPMSEPKGCWREADGFGGDGMGQAAMRKRGEWRGKPHSSFLTGRPESTHTAISVRGK